MSLVREEDEEITKQAFEKMEKPMDENSVAVRFEKIRKV